MWIQTTNHFKVSMSQGHIITPYASDSITPFLYHYCSSDTKGMMWISEKSPHQLKKKQVIFITFCEKKISRNHLTIIVSFITVDKFPQDDLSKELIELQYFPHFLIRSISSSSEKLMEIMRFKLKYHLYTYIKSKIKK